MPPVLRLRDQALLLARAVAVNVVSHLRTPGAEKRESIVRRELQDRRHDRIPGLSRHLVTHVLSRALTSTILSPDLIGLPPALERSFDPEAVWQLKASAGRDLTVGGPDLAAHAFRAGLVDELHLFIAPVVVGGGKQSLPDNVRLKLELLEERRFGSGMVHLRYHIST